MKKIDLEKLHHQVIRLNYSLSRSCPQFHLHQYLFARLDLMEMHLVNQKLHRYRHHCQHYLQFHHYHCQGIHSNQVGKNLHCLNNHRYRRLNQYNLV